MTDKIKSAIETFEDYKENGYDLRSSNVELFDIAIRSLSAWEEVITELRKTKADIKEFNIEYYIGERIGLEKAIDIINQKLADIEGG